MDSPCNRSVSATAQLSGLGFTRPESNLTILTGASSAFIAGWNFWRSGCWQSRPSCPEGSETESSGSTMGAQPRVAFASIELSATVTRLVFYLNFSESSYFKLRSKVAHLNSWVRLSSS